MIVVDSSLKHIVINYLGSSEESILLDSLKNHFLFAGVFRLEELLSSLRNDKIIKEQRGKLSLTLVGSKVASLLRIRVKYKETYIKNKPTIRYLFSAEGRLKEVLSLDSSSKKLECQANEPIRNYEKNVW